MPPAISLKNIGKRYAFYRNPGERVLDLTGVGRLLFWRKSTRQTFWALRELDLEVARGERVGLIGNNGAGKSTLLKVIGGMISPTEGTVQVNGQVQALMELGTGFHPEFTGRQNIHAALAYQGLGFTAIRRGEQEIIDFAELGDFIDRPIKTYSAGMNARLAFATATYLQPEILIIDEILGAGDAYFAGKCVERMRKITENAGATVLFVSHDLSSVQRLCSRVIWIDRGRARMDGEPLAVLKAYADQVRREQELRLKARDMRLGRNQLGGAGEADLFESHLFHLVAETPHPAHCHLVRSLRLLGDDRVIGHIEVGRPMDNVEGQREHLIDGPAMDWGDPVKVKGRWSRHYRDRGGYYHHAPFRFSVPRAAAAGIRTFTLEVDGSFDARERVFVERHAEGGYVRIAALEPGDGVQRLSFPSGREAGAAEAPADPAPAQDAGADEYGSRKVVIRQVRLLDADGNERRVFTTGERLVVEVAYDAAEPVTNPAFVFAAYLPDGQCAAQIWSRSEDLGLRTVAGAGVVRFTIGRLSLGRSAYVASAAVFAELRRDNAEAPAYHCLDRCIHFQVMQPLHEPYPERGLSPQDFDTEIVA